MNINQIAAAASTGNTGSSSASSARQAGADTNMFMTLLVAQLKNQDPLEPQDGTQFVAQLAQFNSLDQLITIRQTMEQLVTALNTTPPTTPNTSTGTDPNSSTKS